MEVVEGRATVDDVDGFVARLGTIGEEHEVAVQALDARYVVDREHLARAVELANRAVARGEAIARDRAVEILCYAAGRRQIQRALEMGVGTGETPVVVVVDAGPVALDSTADGDEASTARGDAGEREAAAAAAVADELEPADTLGAYDRERVREFFDVGDAELAATTAELAELVHERVALLVVEK